MDSYSLLRTYLFSCSTSSWHHLGDYAPKDSFNFFLRLCSLVTIIKSNHLWSFVFLRFLFQFSSFISDLIWVFSWSHLFKISLFFFMKLTQDLQTMNEAHRAFLSSAKVCRLLSQLRELTDFKWFSEWLNVRHAWALVPFGSQTQTTELNLGIFSVFNLMLKKVMLWSFY